LQALLRITRPPIELDFPNFYRYPQTNIHVGDYLFTLQDDPDTNSFRIRQRYLNFVQVVRGSQDSYYLQTYCGSRLRDYHHIFKKWALLKLATRHQGRSFRIFGRLDLTMWLRRNGIRCQVLNRNEVFIENRYELIRNYPQGPWSGPL